MNHLFSCLEIIGFKVPAPVPLAGINDELARVKTIVHFVTDIQPHVFRVDLRDDRRNELTEGFLVSQSAEVLFSHGGKLLRHSLHQSRVLCHPRIIIRPAAEIIILAVKEMPVALYLCFIRLTESQDALVGMLPGILRQAVFRYVFRIVSDHKSSQIAI